MTCSIEVRIYLDFVEIYVYMLTVSICVSILKAIFEFKLGSIEKKKRQSY